MSSQNDSAAPIRFHIPHLVIVRAPGLLPMLYSPTELEEDLGVPARTVRSWLKRGLPCQRDRQHHILINGREFVEWINNVRQARHRPNLSPNEAYCLGCRQPVELSNPQAHRYGKRVVLSGTCPLCGGRVNRGDRDGQQTELPLGKDVPPLSAGRDADA